MPTRIPSCLHCLSLVLLLGAPLPLAAQLPLTPVRKSGQTVSPVFEGWYRNPDGTFSLSFGYFNRNSREVLEIPLGPHNIIKGASVQNQPTRFEPRRHWGVFAVVVPANFGDQKVVWTLVVNGDTLSVPGSLKPNWEIDALNGEADTGNLPPVLKFDAAGTGASGPGGAIGRPLKVAVGQPLELVVWASDDGKSSSSITSDGRTDVPVVLTWFKHQGPGQVTFGNVTPAADRSTGKASTTATFSEPGEYVLRVRANDASGVAGAGHAQCCWSNGFVHVTVTR